MHGVPIRVEAEGRECCPGADLPRHRHTHAYVTLVLRGRYCEAGDAGRYSVEPGTVLVHRPYEAHLDVFSGRAADVLNLPLRAAAPVAGAFRADNGDEIARLAESDRAAAAEALWLRTQPIESEHDWPDLLAEALRQPGDLRVGEWAPKHHLNPSTVSRGFLQAFGTTPSRFRAEARTRLALRAMTNSEMPFAEIAISLGFSDQSHMTRSVVSMTGMSPLLWRRRVKSIQDAPRRAD